MCWQLKSEVKCDARLQLKIDFFFFVFFFFITNIGIAITSLKCQSIKFRENEKKSKKNINLVTAAFYLIIHHNFVKCVNNKIKMLLKGKKRKIMQTVMIEEVIKKLKVCSRNKKIPRRDILVGGQITDKNLIPPQSICAHIKKSSLSSLILFLLLLLV